MSQDNIKLQIDVAVLCQEISKVETMCDKYNIVELVNPCLIHRLSRETIKKTKVKLYNYIQNVFIKVISNDI